MTVAADRTPPSASPTAGRFERGHGRKVRMGGEEEPAGRLRDGTPYYGELGRMRRDGDEQRVQCHLCGGWFRIVGGAHLRLAHGWTIEEYREAFELFKGAATCSDEESGRRRKRTSARVASGEFGTITSRPQAMARAHLAARWPPAISRWRSLAVKHPELLAEWHPTRNEGLDPYAISAGSTHKVWWRCARCGHEWQASPRSRGSYRYGCRVCLGERRRRVPRERSLAVKHPELLAEWHPTRNGELDPYTVGAGSTHKVWWLCARCGHEWQTTPWLRHLEGTGCPVCGRRRASEHKTRVARERSLAVRHPELLAEWHPTRNDGLDPYTVGAGSERSVWWRCGRCQHEWRTSPKERKRGTGCPACARRLRGQRKAHVPRERSLAVRAPALLADWHPTSNEGVDPYSVGVGSDRVVWWRCHRCGHEWQARPNQRRAGQRCSACRASPEAPHT